MSIMGFLSIVLAYVLVMVVIYKEKKKSKSKKKIKIKTDEEIAKEFGRKSYIGRYALVKKDCCGNACSRERI